MAKKKISDETRRKIAAKAREREARKREEKEKASAPPNPGRATKIPVSGIVVRHTGPEIPPPRDGETEPADISPQARKKIAELAALRATFSATVEELGTEAKALKEASDLASIERDKVIEKVRVNGTIEPDENESKTIKRLSGHRAAALAKLADVRGRKKAASAGIKQALAETDRIIAGESPVGTMWENTPAAASTSKTVRNTAIEKKGGL